MNRNSRGLLICLLLIPFVVNAAWNPPELSFELSPVDPPITAPDFLLKDMDEQGYRLSNYRGKVVLLNFWATWCPPCRREMPSMQRLFQKLNSSDFVVIAVNQTEDPDHVFAFTGQIDADLTFPIIFDTDSQVALDYKVKGLPTTFLIDKQGKIRFQAIGGREFDHPEVEKTIIRLMAE